MMELRRTLGNQDLLQQTKPEREPLPKGFFKLLATELLSVLSAATTGWLFLRFLNDSASIYAVLTAAAFWFAFSVLGSLVTMSNWRRLLLVVLEVTAFLISFRNIDLSFLFAAALIFVIFEFWGELTARRNHENSLKFSFITFSHLKFSKMLTGFILAGLIVYVPNMDPNKSLISQKTFETTFNSAAKISKVAYPEIDLSSTVGQFTEKMVKQQFYQDPDFARLTPTVQSEQITTAKEEMRLSAEKSLGISLTADESLAQAFYSYFSKNLEGWRKSFGGGFSLLWGLLLFFLLRGAGVVFLWAALIIAGAIFEALVAMGGIAIVGETKTKERAIFI